MLLVVQMHATRTDALKRTIEQLGQSGNRVLGMVLNQPDRSRHGYYASYYDASYYGTDAERKKPQKRASQHTNLAQIQQQQHEQQ
jgi:Mrp family chromosome partitioning ATPase